MPTLTLKPVGLHNCGVNIHPPIIRKVYSSETQENVRGPVQETDRKGDENLGGHAAAPHECTSLDFLSVTTGPHPGRADIVQNHVTPTTNTKDEPKPVGVLNSGTDTNVSITDVEVDHVQACGDPREVLRGIDPNCDYMVWIGCAICRLLAPYAGFHDSLSGATSGGGNGLLMRV